MQLRNEHILQSCAPAALTQTPDDSRVSDKYSFLPTTSVLSVLEDEGWEIWDATQVNSRSWSPKHARHLIRLRHRDISVNDFSAGDSFPEMIVSNSHNGISSYTLRGGIFRMVCSNGMIISEEDFGTVEIRHIGFEAQQVIDASRELIRSSTKVASKINNWKEIILSEDDTEEYFNKATKLRFSGPSEGIVDRVRLANRVEDTGRDLWSFHNVAQENLLRGGYYNPETNRKVRPITNIQRNLALNSDLWSLSSSYSNN